jgi:hypothetical protein
MDPPQAPQRSTMEKWITFLPRGLFDCPIANGMLSRAVFAQPDVFQIVS